MSGVLVHICCDLGSISIAPVGEIERNETFEANVFCSLVGICQLGWGVTVDVGIIEREGINPYFHGISHVCFPVGNSVVLDNAHLF